MPALLIAYPVLVHLAVLWNEPRLEWLALVVMCAIPLYHGLRRLLPGHWVLWLALAALLYALTRMGGGIYALFLPPVVTPAVMLAVFAGSLRAGQVPLVTRLAQLGTAPLDGHLRSYTRRVTQLWVLLLALLTLWDAALALWAPLAVWSLVSNGINYVLVASLLVLEYGYRRVRFPDFPHRGLMAHLRMVARTDYRAV